MKEQRYKQKILVVDDSEMNRAILSEMLGEEYEIIEAENGVQAIALLQKYESELSLVLLDIVMPEMDGFGVLSVMNQRHWINEVPVIMISAESAFTHMERAYDLGITDYINRPFDARVVHRRVVNTILLYAKQKKLIGLVEDQIYEKEKQSKLMVDILSHIVEFRNGESGLHVLHIRMLTDLLLKKLIQITDRYPISRSDIALIGTASALHDIGKIAIDEAVLNKPGRLTDEEFAVMKTHSMIGAKMLSELPIHQDESLVKTAYEICRWHHERYDGRGYPDGLKGDEIPISAQIVALADVYDALTSERVYKKAFSHEVAIQMILDNQCGVFNPLLMQCLREIADTLQEELRSSAQSGENQEEMHEAVEELLLSEDLNTPDRMMELLDYERTKYNFFAEISQEIRFEYTETPSVMTLSAWSAERLKLPEVIMEPMHDEKVLAMFESSEWKKLKEEILKTTPQNPVFRHNCKMVLDGSIKMVQIVARTIWSGDEKPKYKGIFGKIADV